MGYRPRFGFSRNRRHPVIGTISALARARGRLAFKKSRRRLQAGSNTVYNYTQLQCMKFSNVSVGTGATVYQNPTSTVTYIGSTAANVLNDSCFAMYFTLNDCIQASTFTALYDQYRIDKVQVIIGRTNNQQSAGNSTQNLTFPSQQLWYVVDHDDATVLTSLTDIMQYQGAQCKNIMDNGEVKITFKPRIAVAAYAAGVFTSFSNQSAGWIDAASPTVQHFGLKLVIPCPINVTFAEMNFTVRTKLWLSFKSVR